MSKKKLITESKVPEDFFSVKLKPISKETQRRLEVAGAKANENIRRNNLVYASSNAHSNEYPSSSSYGIRKVTSPDESQSVMPKNGGMVDELSQIKKDNEKLDILLNNINSNMEKYNEDINAQMNISDDLEIKRLKRANDMFQEEISEYEQDQKHSQGKLLDLIKDGTEISTEEGLKDVIHIDWSNDTLTGKYRDQTIVISSSESEGRKLTKKP